MSITSWRFWSACTACPPAAAKPPESTGSDLLADVGINLLPELEAGKSAGYPEQQPTKGIRGKGTYLGCLAKASSRARLFIECGQILSILAPWSTRSRGLQLFLCRSAIWYRLQAFPSLVLTQTPIKGRLPDPEHLRGQELVALCFSYRVKNRVTLNFNDGNNPAHAT